MRAVYYEITKGNKTYTTTDYEVMREERGRGASCVTRLADVGISAEQEEVFRKHRERLQAVRG